MNWLKKYFGLTFWFLLIAGLFVAVCYWSQNRPPLTSDELQSLTNALNLME